MGEFGEKTAVEAVKRTQFEEMVERFNDRLLMLDESINNLNRKINPILRQEESCVNEGEIEKTPEYTSQIELAFQSMTFRVDAMIRQTKEMRDRCVL